jgi:hypothetical protein
MGVIVSTCLAAAPSSAADAVVYWNEIASTVISAPANASRGPATMLDFATVHAAIYDAVQAIEGDYQPYHVVIPNASGSPAAAAARAARDVLVNRFPAQAGFVDSTYHAYLIAHSIAEDDPGVSVGAEAAAGIIALRSTDRSFPPDFPPFFGGPEPGMWRPTTSYNAPFMPTSGAPMAVPWLGSVTPFTLTHSQQLRPQPPPHLTSGQYTQDYNEVKALGSLDSVSRTAEQTDLAYFYADSYAPQWNRVLRSVADANVHDIAASARLFALANMAGADSFISSWDSKRHYAMWRPVTAIHDAEKDGNPNTDADPAWRPLINTPNYPDYTSGANNITAAMTRALSLFFERDTVTFTVTSLNARAQLKTRTYTRFSDASDDVVDARVYLGIHFRFADTAARKQGRHAAQWAYEHFFRPVGEVR